MKFVNAMTFCLFQVVLIPVWIFLAVCRQWKILYLPWGWDSIVWRALDPLGTIFWPLAIFVLHVGDAMLTGPLRTKGNARKKPIEKAYADALRLSAALVVICYGVCYKLSFDFRFMDSNGKNYFAFEIAVSVSMQIACIFIYKQYASIWHYYGVQRSIADAAAMKGVLGSVISAAGSLVFNLLSNGKFIRETYMKGASAEAVWDSLTMGLLCVLILPGGCKLYSMCFFGDFTVLKNGDSKCVVLCKMPITSYRRHRLGLMHIVQTCLKYRIGISKFIFIFNAPLVVLPNVAKDFYYSMFHFGLKIRSAFVVGVMRSKRSQDKNSQHWNINDAPSSTLYSESNSRVARVWKTAAKYSVDWIPHWARVAYPFSLEYPFDLLRNLGRGPGSREATLPLKLNHNIRTAYYGAGSYFMRVGNLPGFCFTDAIGMTHYRRYKRACVSMGFTRLWTEWILGESRKGMINCIEEYEGINQVCKDTVTDACYSDMAFPLGVVPKEQFIQFQYVLCVFHERMHMQLYLRQGVKLSTNLTLISLLLAWIALQNYTRSICGMLNWDRKYGMETCICMLKLQTKVPTLTHVAKASGFLLIDMCETAATFKWQMNSVQASHGRFVFEWGKVSRMNQVLVFNVTNWIMVQSLSILLFSFGLLGISGGGLSGWTGLGLECPAGDGY